MKIVFADACYYFALLMDQDQYAAAAREFTASYHGKFVTTTAVLTEVGNSLARSPKRSAFIPFVEVLVRSPRVDIRHASLDDWDRATRLYDARPDKAWSLTDCLSFIVMQDRGLTEAMTADRHFEQAGFSILLK